MANPECQRLINVIKTKDLKINHLKQQITRYKTTIKELNDQRKTDWEETKKEIEELKEKKEQFEKEVIRLQNEIEELKKELKKKVDSLENRIKENEKGYQKQMKDMKENYKSDLRKLEDRNAKRIQGLEKGQDKGKKELEECRVAFELYEDENQKLKAENRELKNELADNRKIISYFEKDRNKVYIGQICMELPTNLYRYVMPQHCCANNCYYKIKDIENDIDDEDVRMSDEERQKARKRFEKLNEILNWEKLKRLNEAMKRLQDTRNEVAHPPVDEKGAIGAARKLDEEGKLKGKISFERVKQIIEMWSVSKSLLGDQNSNYD